MRNYLLIILTGAQLLCISTIAQQIDETSLTRADTVTNFSAFNRSLGFSGVLQTRYIASFTNGVDVNGRNFDPTADPKGVRNTFLVKRARVMIKANINDHFSANILANFADFNGNASNKVLENAYIKYSSINTSMYRQASSAPSSVLKMQWL